MTTHHSQIPETFVEDRRLGRHVAHDEQSRDYPAEQAPRIISVRHTALGLPLDQGSIGSCTAQALCAARNSAPDYHEGDLVLDEAAAVRLYSAETALEGEPYPPNDPGGSGLMVCRAAKAEGLITSYHHAFGIEHALRALVLRPVIFGVNWYSSFDHVDTATGLVAIGHGATIRGGHEVCADEIDAPNQLVWFWQSWGPWGLEDSGRFCMTFATLERLLVEQGDATVPVR